MKRGGEDGKEEGESVNVMVEMKNGIESLGQDGYRCSGWPQGSWRAGRWQLKPKREQVILMLLPETTRKGGAG